MRASRNARIGGDGALVGAQRGLGVVALERHACASNQSVALFGASTRLRASITLSEPAAGSPSNVEQVLPGLRLPAAAALAHDDAVGHGADASPESGIESGRRRRSSFIDLVMRRWGTFAVDQRLRGAQHDQVLERERHASRGPRAGETKPAAIKARIVLRGRRSSVSTSRTPYGC